MKINDYLIWMLVVTLLSLAYIQTIPELAKAKAIMADREYWRLMASSPEWLCRARGGKYHASGFYQNFTEGWTKLNWECKEF